MKANLKWYATKGKKLTQAGRSTSDGMLDLLKRGKTKDDDSTTNKSLNQRSPNFTFQLRIMGNQSTLGYERAYYRVS